MRKKIVYIFLILFALQLSAQDSISAQDSKRKTIDNADVIHKPVVERAEYPGGGEALTDFLKKKIKYPAEARKKGIEGRVVVEFVVVEDGSLSGFRVIRDNVGYGAGEEVIRVLKKSKKWKPAKIDGNRVRFYYRLPVIFTLPS